MCKIAEVFSKKFEHSRMIVDETDIFIGNKKEIPQGDWRIKFVVDQDENGLFLEYYGTNSRKMHAHGRIYNNGQEERLDVLQEYVAYSPDVPGDLERSEREFRNHNERVLSHLRQKQLM